MKTARRPFNAFCIGCMVVLSNFRASAQNKTPLPGNLKPDSSVAEILTWLDQTTFRSARIVMKDSRDTFEYSPPWDDTEPAKNTFIFTRGFRVTNIDGCNLMLRNDDATEVVKSKVDESSRPLVVDIWLQLDRMSWDKGKHPHRFTRDWEKVRLLGAWRTDFRYYGWFSRTILELKLQSAEWKLRPRWVGSNIAFTFDTKEMSEQFDAAFRHAIKLCRAKKGS